MSPLARKFSHAASSGWRVHFQGRQGTKGTDLAFSQKVGFFMKKWDLSLKLLFRECKIEIHIQPDTSPLVSFCRGQQASCSLTGLALSPRHAHLHDAPYPAMPLASKRFCSSQSRVVLYRKRKENVQVSSTFCTSEMEVERVEKEASKDGHTLEAGPFIHNF